MWEDKGRSRGFCLEGWKRLPSLAHFLLLHILHGYCFHALASGSSYRPHFWVCWPGHTSSEGGLATSHLLMSYLSFALSLSQALCLYILWVLVLRDSKIFPGMSVRGRGRGLLNLTHLPSLSLLSSWQVCMSQELSVLLVLEVAWEVWGCGSNGPLYPGPP